jgi:two-component system, response regulator PdtaR
MSIAVLLAEDEYLIALDLMDELAAAGFVTIGPFAETAQALEYCRLNTPDCAVLDIRLSDGESYPLADLLAERNVPVIFHSGHASPPALARRYPNMRVCPKPAPSMKIANLVAELCAQLQPSLAGAHAST